MSELIPLIEAFGPTIQGEGALTGQVSYFLRFGGCDYRCTWCDSMHAVDPNQIKKNSQYLLPGEIIDVAIKLNEHPNLRPWITLSGGNPAIWNLQKVVMGLKAEGMRVAIETQGSMRPDWFDYLDLITVSPKPPSSGMLENLDLRILDSLVHRYGNDNRNGNGSRDRIVFKVVIFNSADLDFAEGIKKLFPGVPFYLSVGTAVPGPFLRLRHDAVNGEIIKDYRWLAEEVLKRTALWGSVVSPQMHVLLWGHEKGV